MSAKQQILRFIFFIGWLLSPFTFWNDVFVNIPLAYLCANILLRVWPVDFLLSVLIFYWLSNGLGVVLMYLSGKDLFTGKGKALREVIKLLVTLVVYSAVLVLLHKFGILKPL